MLNSIYPIISGCSLSSLSSVRSADTASINSSVSSSESDSSMVSNDPQRLTLQFLVDPHEVSRLFLVLFVNISKLKLPNGHMVPK